MKTREQVQAIVDRFPFERYGRVNLPYGFHTKGLDRSPAKEIIFPKSFQHKTLLDVGSAYGYWCFEAEALGAEKVVGLEVKPARLARAKLFKNVRESKAEFRNEDITKLQLEGEFDYVLVLNVLHHLPNALEVLDFLRSKAKEKLIIESPIAFRGVKIMEVVGSMFPKVEYFPSVLEVNRKIAICTQPLRLL